MLLPVYVLLDLESYLLVATTILAAFGMIFTWLQYRIASVKRKDDLFKLRYEFYKKLSKSWLETYDKSVAPFDIVDLIPIAAEASLIFDKSVADHILSLDQKRPSNPFFCDNDFSKPFYKFLNLK